MNALSKLEEIFFAALERSTAVERAEFLQTACGADVELRQNVERLLSAHPLAQDFLACPAVDRMAVETSDGAGQTQTFRMDSASDSDGDSEAGNDFAFLTPGTRTGSLGRIGRYEVLDVVGRGAFGVVFRALDESLLRVVAVKVLSPQLAAMSPPRRRFLREARSSAMVRHENVVQVYAVEEQPLPYLVMEFIPGETLQQRIDRIGPLAADQAAEIGRQVAEGLAAAHATGLIHRDIKPGNIMVETGATLRVKITDFGLARAADDASLTQSGIIAGTPMYMSPEQVAGESFDHRADLFSLGSVLYTICSGQSPFRANSTLAAMKRVAEETPRPIREVIPEVPGWLCDIIGRLHSKRPDDRIATAKEVAELLERGLVESRNPGATPWLPFGEGAAAARLDGGHAPREDAAPADPRPTPASPVPGGRRLVGNHRWAAAAAAVLIAVAGLGFTEANGFTDFRGTVVRLLSPAGTLVVEVDDPDVSVKIDGAELVITGAGFKEIRLTPGSYTLEASRQGKVLLRELVNVEKNGRQVVRVSQEAQPTATAAAQGVERSAEVIAWEESVAGLPAKALGKAVAERLRQRNPGFDGGCEFEIQDAAVVGLSFHSDRVSDLSPLRVLKQLRSLDCSSRWQFREPSTNLSADASNDSGKVRMKSVEWSQLADLSPLTGLPLTSLSIVNTQVDDLTPLRGMRLKSLRVSSTRVHDLSPLREMPLELLECSFVRVADLRPLRGMRLTEAQFEATDVADLTPLRGMPLTSISVGALVSDLSPLRGMPLRGIQMGNSAVSDLASLEGMPLELLSFYGTKVTDISILRGMRTLKRLVCSDRVSDLTPLEGLSLEFLQIGPLVTDLTPLKGMPLQKLEFEKFLAERDADLVRGLKSLETINGQPTVQFWSRVDETQWQRWVAALPAEEQVRAVVARLQELNPDFDGVATSTIENGVVTRFSFRSDDVTDIAPVRALAGLTELVCKGTYPGTAKLKDLSPLRGMSLKLLDFSCSLVSDLAPLQGMPLRKLDIGYTRVTDLSALREMTLHELSLVATSVRDLSPLTGMKLHGLYAMAIPATDLTPLRGMPLVQLDLYGTSGVSDLQFLKGMPLEYLNLTKLPVKDLAVLKDMSTLRYLVLVDTQVSDITPLRGLEIQGLQLNGTLVTNLDVLSTLSLKRLEIDLPPGRAEFLRGLKGLEVINNKPVAEFWKELDEKQQPPAEPDK